MENLTDVIIEAETLEGAQAAPGVKQAEPAPMAIDPVESFAAFLSVLPMAAGVIGYKRTAKLWNATTCRELASKLVPVLVKYPWGQKIMRFVETGAGVEEVALGLFVVGVIPGTLAAVRADQSALQPIQELEPVPEIVVE